MREKAHSRRRAKKGTPTHEQVNGTNVAVWSALEAEISDGVARHTEVIELIAPNIVRRAIVGSKGESWERQKNLVQGNLLLWR